VNHFSKGRHVPAKKTEGRIETGMDHYVDSIEGNSINIVIEVEGKERRL
jgi:hypothetical protein